MTATIRTTNGESFEYNEAYQIKESDGKYVVYDRFLSVLGVHRIEEVEQILTVPPTEPLKSDNDV